MQCPMVSTAECTALACAIQQRGGGGGGGSGDRSVARVVVVLHAYNVFSWRIPI
jgi:hypothetical protein